MKIYLPIENLLIAFASLFIGTSTYSQSSSELQDLRKIIAVQQSQIHQLQNLLSKNIECKQGPGKCDWIGNPTNLVGPTGQNGKDGNNGQNGANGKDGPGAYWANGSTYVIPGYGGQLHLNRSGNMCLYVDNLPSVCFNLPVAR